MINRTFNKYLFAIISSIISLVQPVSANDKISAYELLYDEQETGTDVYTTRFLVTNRYIRIDDLSDDSGYIIYDDKVNTIYSVSHFDQSVLLIPEYNYEKPDMQAKVIEQYEALTDAPKISGKTVYSFRANSVSGSKEICVDMQLVPGLLPEVAEIMRNYQKIVAGQQSKILKNTPEEYRTTCFMYNQVFNDGEYYSKGLPIQEWHSNGRKKVLTSYRERSIEPDVFKRNENYREYSLD
jgi:hypothetical protein